MTSARLTGHFKPVTLEPDPSLRLLDPRVESSEAQWTDAALGEVAVNYVSAGAEPAAVLTTPATTCAPTSLITTV